jgi:hypothetical protein
MMNGLPFQEVWAVDFEFIANPGERPAPVCMLANCVAAGGCGFGRSNLGRGLRST